MEPQRQLDGHRIGGQMPRRIKLAEALGDVIKIMVVAIGRGIRRDQAFTTRSGISDRTGFLPDALPPLPTGVHGVACISRR